MTFVSYLKSLPCGSKNTQAKAPLKRFWSIMIVMFGTALQSCTSTAIVVECPEGSVTEGNGPPLGRRIACVNKQKRSGERRAYRQGPEIRWFAGGALRSRQTYVHDKLEGEAKTWFANGQKSKSGHYVDGRRHGVWTEYDRDGILQSETTFKDGLMNGPRRFYYPTGPLKSEHRYQIGIIHGGAKGVYPDGTLRFRGRYGDNVRQGVWHLFERSGELTKATYYVDGKETTPPPP
jgi:antitoxin component YwqK of YwqJK toxin-antitoxin module